MRIGNLHRRKGTLPTFILKSVFLFLAKNSVHHLNKTLCVNDIAQFNDVVIVYFDLHKGK